MTIRRLGKATKESLQQINVLLSQLRSDDSGGTMRDLTTLLADKNAIVLVVLDGKTIVGLGTLYIMRKLGRANGHIEDVVVDSAYRGQGLGEQLMRALLAAGKQKKLTSVYLTSRPHREAAHRLYHKVGFKVKETTVFKYTY